MRIFWYGLGVVGVACNEITAVLRFAADRPLDAAAWAILGLYIIGTCIMTAQKW